MYKPHSKGFYHAYSLTSLTRLCGRLIHINLHSENTVQGTRTKYRIWYCNTDFVAFSSQKSCVKNMLSIIFFTLIPNKFALSIIIYHFGVDTILIILLKILILLNYETFSTIIAIVSPWLLTIFVINVIRASLNTQNILLIFCFLVSSYLFLIFTFNITAIREIIQQLSKFC